MTNNESNKLGLVKAGRRSRQQSHRTASGRFLDGNDINGIIVIVTENTRATHLGRPMREQSATKARGERPAGQSTAFPSTIVDKSFTSEIMDTLVFMLARPAPATEPVDRTLTILIHASTVIAFYTNQIRDQFFPKITVNALTEPVIEPNKFAQVATTASISLFKALKHCLPVSVSERLPPYQVLSVIPVHFSMVLLYLARKPVKPVLAAPPGAIQVIITIPVEASSLALEVISEEVKKVVLGAGGWVTLTGDFKPLVEEALLEELQSLEEEELPVKAVEGEGMQLAEDDEDIFVYPTKSSEDLITTTNVDDIQENNHPLYDKEVVALSFIDDLAPTCPSPVESASLGIIDEDEEAFVYPGGYSTDDADFVSSDEQTTTNRAETNLNVDEEASINPSMFQSQACLETSFIVAEAEPYLVDQKALNEVLGDDTSIVETKTDLEITESPLFSPSENNTGRPSVETVPVEPCSQSTPASFLASRDIEEEIAANDDADTGMVEPCSLVSPVLSEPPCPAFRRAEPMLDVPLDELPASETLASILPDTLHPSIIFFNVYFPPIDFPSDKAGLFRPWFDALDWPKPSCPRRISLPDRPKLDWEMISDQAELEAQ
ncbi:hypothetical protein C8J56DRAFT_895353 [Mycena floridula]|nr:hypothetical protein C8J56DRAFT_895353 [Mycena floridula]